VAEHLYLGILILLDEIREKKVEVSNLDRQVRRFNRMRGDARLYNPSEWIRLTRYDNPAEEIKDHARDDKDEFNPVF
jgi:hypothetical protein